MARQVNGYSPALVRRRAALIAVCLLAAACGSSGSPAAGSSGPGATKPTVSLPASAPSTLQSTDLIVGTGTEATAGRVVTVQYVGVSFTTKKQFDASWDRGTPFTFQLGAGRVIPGWDQGVVGMKVGGRRELVIPPSLGYGDQANGGIPANDTLVFVIDLVSVS